MNVFQYERWERRLFESTISDGLRLDLDEPLPNCKYIDDLKIIMCIYSQSVVVVFYFRWSLGP